MSARCQLGLKSSQSMEQAMFFDETYVLEMPHLNQEPFSKGFVNSSFTQNSTMTNAISPSPAVSIPKSNSGYFGTEEYQGGGNQNELEFIAVTDLGFEDNFSSTLGACGGYGGDFDSPLSPSLWSPNPADLKSDDMLSVNKNDLVQDPTLTQLNANEESLLDDLNDFDLPDLLPEDKSSISALSDFEDTKIRWDKYKDIPSAQESATCLTQNITQTKASIPFSTSVPTPSNPSPWLEQPPLIAKVKTEPKSEETNPCTKANVLTLEGLLSQYRTTPTFKPLMDVNSSSTNTSRLSSSAPANPGFDMWKGSHQNVLQSPPLLKADEPPKSTASVSSASTSDLYGTKDDFDSHDEGFDSEPEDTDHYEEFTSDAESTVSEDLDNRKTSASVSPSPKPSKKERFFWQYNVQAKGPKINRLCLNPRNSDPHLLNEVTDPVFSSICSVQGIKHRRCFPASSGKARRGDGNDLTPNARKLHQIGQELKKLNKIINDLTPVSELPFNARPKSRKEKNKLASRACRLKKKAQHEANKVKLYGLEHEHKKLLHCLKEVRKLLVIRVQEQENGKETEKLVPQMEKVLKTNLKTKIAGNTAEFVNQILARLSEGKGMTCLDDF